MEIAELLKYVNKYNIADPRSREAKRDAVKRVVGFEFATVDVSDVFDLYNNLTEVVDELADDDASFDAKKGRRALEEVLSYPEVMRYVTARYEETYSEESEDITLDDTSSDDDSDDDVSWDWLDRVEKRIAWNNALTVCIALANLSVNLFGVYLLTRGA